MADWLEEFHENVHPIGDRDGFWSGTIGMTDPDTAVMELWVRIPVTRIMVQLVLEKEEETLDD